MKKKSIVLGVVIALLVVAVLVGLAIYNGKWSRVSDFVVEDGKLTKYSGTSAFVSIPRTVTSISSFAFFDHAEIERVTIPDSVTTIGQGAFYGCTNLKTLKLSKNLTYIDDGAFGECDSLTVFTVPASVQYIIEGAFYGSDALAEFRVESGSAVFTAEDGVLYTLDHSVVVAYPPARAGSSYTIADGTLYAAAWSFYGAKSLTAVAFPESLDRIGEEAFYGSGLTILTLPAALTELGSGAFQNCAGIPSVQIPDGVTAIPVRAFGGCAALSSVTLPEGVTKIDQYAFENCASLASINIPKAVVDIADNSFSGCEAVTLRLPSGSLLTQYAEELGLAYEIGD